MAPTPQHMATLWWDHPPAYPGTQQFNTAFQQGQLALPPPPSDYGYHQQQQKQRSFQHPVQHPAQYPLQHPVQHPHEPIQLSQQQYPHVKRELHSEASSDYDESSSPPKQDVDKQMEHLLQKNRDLNDTEYESIIKDHEHSQVMAAAYRSHNNRKAKFAVRQCRDFPSTPAAQRKLVKQIFDAILNTDGIIDKMKKVCKKKEVEDEEPEYKTGTHVQRILSLTKVEVEILAWKILFAIRDAQNGDVGVGNWSFDFKYAPCDNFTARFEKVVESIKTSKAVVHGIISAPKLMRLAAHPEIEIKRKKNNYNINGVRNDQVKIAIKAVNDHLYTVDPETKEVRDREGKIISGRRPAHGLVDIKKDEGERPAKRHRSAGRMTPTRQQPARVAPQVRASRAPAQNTHPNNATPAQNLLTDQHLLAQHPYPSPDTVSPTSRSSHATPSPVLSMYRTMNHKGVGQPHDMFDHGHHMIQNQSHNPQFAGCGAEPFAGGHFTGQAHDFGGFGGQSCDGVFGGMPHEYRI